MVFLFRGKGIRLLRSSIQMSPLQLAAVSLSSKAKSFIKIGRISRNRKVSTFRELLAVSLLMKAFAKSLQAQLVTWFTNNQYVVSVVNCGSKVPALQDLAMDSYQSCLLNGVSIDMPWIARDLNSAADDTSKFIDHDDYTNKDIVCNALDEYEVFLPVIGSLACTMPKFSV